MKKTSRKYNREEDALQTNANQLAGSNEGNSNPRASGSGRGKKKRGGASNLTGGKSSDLSSRTVVASNPFDDDAPIITSHLHQVHQHSHQHSLNHAIDPQPLHYSSNTMQNPQGTSHQVIESPYDPSGTQLPHHHITQMAPMQMHPQASLPPRSMQPPPHPHYTDNHHQLYDPQSQASITSPPPPPPSIRHPVFSAGPSHPSQNSTYPYRMSPPPLPDRIPQPQLAEAPPSQILNYCAECRQPIYSSETSIICRAGCEAYYHQQCSGLIELACELLLREPAAEWACNRCICSNRRIPIVRIPNQSQNVDSRQSVW